MKTWTEQLKADIKWHDLTEGEAERCALALAAYFMEEVGYIRKGEHSVISGT